MVTFTKYTSGLKTKDGSTGLVCSVVVNCVDTLGEFETTISERINLVTVDTSSSFYNSKVKN